MAGAVAEFTTENFESEVLEGEGLVVVDFWAPWCGPCRHLAPLVEELARDNPDIKFGKINIDENPDAAHQYQIGSIPTLMFFKKGEVVESYVGVPPKPLFRQMLDANKA